MEQIRIKIPNRMVDLHFLTRFDRYLAGALHAGEETSTLARGLLRDCRGSATRGRYLDAKLPQVMVDMLVHSFSPLLGCEFAEEAVRLGGAVVRATFGEAVD